MALVQRLIDVTFTLNTGTFKDTGTGTLKLSGLRIRAEIRNAGGIGAATASLTLYGMTLSSMRRLSTLGMEINKVPNNEVIVEAGDATGGMHTVFIGTIVNAYTDLQNAPDVTFRVEGQSGYAAAVDRAPVLSFKGSTSAAMLMQKVATAAGFSFTNNGVSSLLESPYYAGSYRQQLQRIAEHAGILWTIESNVVAIWPKWESRGGTTATVSPTSGLVGYPTFTESGVMVTVLFTSLISYGQAIKIEGSQLEEANGPWYIFGLDYDLDALMPDGHWFCIIKAYPAGFTPLQIQGS